MQRNLQKNSLSKVQLTSPRFETLSVLIRRETSRKKCRREARIHRFFPPIRGVLVIPHRRAGRWKSLDFARGRLSRKVRLDQVSTAQPCRAVQRGCGTGEMCSSRRRNDDSCQYYGSVENSCCSGADKKISDFFSQLFPGIPRDRFSTLSCAHVIPKNNLLTKVICRGPRKQEFEFKFANRSDDALVNPLSRSRKSYENFKLTCSWLTWGQSYRVR